MVRLATFRRLVLHYGSYRLGAALAALLAQPQVPQVRDWRDRDDSNPYGSKRSIRLESAILVALIAFVIMTTGLLWWQTA